MLPVNSPVAALTRDAAKLLHSDQYLEAGQLVAKWFSETSRTPLTEVKDRNKATEFLTLLLHWLLENEGFEDAAELLWGETLFSYKPKFCQRIWRAFEESNYILLQGSASTSKSFSMGVRLMLEFIRDPEYTSVKVLGPSEAHLESNLFTHLVTLHRQSSIPLPGEVGKLFIGLDTRERKSSITGVVIPLGTKAAGRLQGTKRSPRKIPHPRFGPLSRLFIFLDEAAVIPVGIWRDLANLVASSQGDDGLKIIGAFNPTNVGDEVGIRAEPPQGWALFDPEKDFDWTSTRGWRVVRLDALQCENVVERKIIFHGLQTYEGYQQSLQSLGFESAAYWTYLRGAYPPAGVPMSIIPQGLLVGVRAEVQWYERPTPVGAVDLALLGGDSAVFAKGSFGIATGVKYMPSAEHPTGRTVIFRNTAGTKNLPRNVILLEAVLKLPRGDTIEMADEVLRVARSFSIAPDWLCMDQTGTGQGVVDLVRYKYGEVRGVNFSESASETRILQEDHAVAKELFDRMNSELWFALRKMLDANVFFVAPGVETSELFPELSTRRYRMSGKRARVEEKEAFKARGNGKSPDSADAVTLLVHAVRKAAGFIPSITVENSVAEQFDDREDFDQPRIDVTNRFEQID